MAKLPTIRPKQTRIQGVWRTFKEMLGREETQELTVWQKMTALWSLYNSKTSIDYSKVNYALTRALYYASEMEDRINKRKVGAQFLLGAIFAKPIVNAATAFILRNPLQIEVEGAEKAMKSINGWLKKNHSYVQLALRNSQREGDSYLAIEKDGTPRLLPPEYVDKKTNILNADEVIGFDVTRYVSETAENDRDKMTKYVTEYREKSTITYKYSEDKKTRTRVDEMSEDFDKEQPVCIIHFANEREAGALYGNSEYQSCYTYFANYHAVLESGVQGVIYNNTPVPTITGVENVEEFKEQNGTKDDNGNVVVKWDNKKLMIGGKDVQYNMLQANDMTGGTEKILNILFWGICQTSETPEFVFGTAVQSSKASVSEQMPVMLAKAERKRGVYEESLRELVEVLAFVLSQLNPGDFKSMPDDFTIVWPQMVKADDEVNIKKAEFGLENGLITKKTALQMIDVEQWVSDLDAELEEAEKEEKKRQEEQQALFPTMSTSSNRLQNEKKSVTDDPTGKNDPKNPEVSPTDA
jgi:hypothetical protein